MVEKLKLTVKQIHWSLSVKALAFALGWLFLPFWLFLFLALGLYLTPLFQSVQLALPFLVTLFLAGVSETGSIWVAVCLGLVFYLLLGVKDLVLVNRGIALRACVYLLLFLGAIRFSAAVANWEGSGVFLAPVLPALVLFFLLRQLFSFEPAPAPGGIPPAVAAALGALLFWEAAWAAILLPLAPLHQAAMLFISVAVAIELLTGSLRQDLKRSAIVTNSLLLLVLYIIILITARA
ncbi:MAG: hypothetical protein HY978_04440 [Candidatus Liptonbacteria bacterium]|nr:hypothetical protein [Candidatus Liptonbacteria bacterium]